MPSACVFRIIFVTQLPVDLDLRFDGCVICRGIRMICVVPFLRDAVIYEGEHRCVCQDWVSACINPHHSQVLAEFSLPNTTTFYIREKRRSNPHQCRVMRRRFTGAGLPGKFQPRNYSTVPQFLPEDDRKAIKASRGTTRPWRGREDPQQAVHLPEAAPRRPTSRCRCSRERRPPAFFVSSCASTTAKLRHFLA